MLVAHGGAIAVHSGGRSAGTADRSSSPHPVRGWKLRRRWLLVSTETLDRLMVYPPNVLASRGRFSRIGLNLFLFGQDRHPHHFDAAVAGQA